jgi:hypothetical protein
MYRQLYMGGGIGSLEAGAPSIKYEGDIRPQMASAPDPMAELYNMFLDLKQQGQIPKEMGFEQFKQLMERTIFFRRRYYANGTKRTSIIWWY